MQRQANAVAALSRRDVTRLRSIKLQRGVMQPRCQRCDLFTRRLRCHAEILCSIEPERRTSTLSTHGHDASRLLSAEVQRGANMLESQHAAWQPSRTCHEAARRGSKEQRKSRTSALQRQMQSTANSSAHTLPSTAAAPPPRAEIDDGVPRPDFGVGAP